VARRVRRSAQEQRLWTEVLRRMGEVAFSYVHPLIPSATLQDELQWTLLKGREEGVALVLKSYWAIFLHDGRGPVLPKRARFIVFWRNPRQDPRNAGGFPVRRSEITRLTKQEFQAGLMQNRAARAQGLPPPMIVMRTKDFRVVPTGPAEGKHFFEVPELPGIIIDKLGKLFTGHIETEIMRPLSYLKRKRNIRINL
jgi:hypothetical protein